VRNFDEYIEQRRSESEDFRHEYDRLGPLYSLIGDVLHLRGQNGLTQTQLAQRMGRQQPSIGRFEAGNTNPTLGFLQDIAEALGAKLVVRIEPIDNEKQASREEESSPERPASRRKRRASSAA
jgi:transcriptional regulator with XRE-family HTH domain